MALTDLLTKKCVPCEKGTPKLPAARVKELLAQLDGWKLQGEKIVKTITLKDFKEAMAFLNRVAEVAEAEQHHPDFAVHYNKVDFTLSTHDVGGLSENDFIVAAKIDAVR